MAEAARTFIRLFVRDFFSLSLSIRRQFLIRLAINRRKGLGMKKFRASV